MEENRRQIQLGFCADHFPEGIHICYVFNDDDEQRRVMAKFLSDGLANNERVLYLADMISPEEMLAQFAALGTPFNPPPALRVAAAAPVYCPFGKFRPARMLDIIRCFYRQARLDGYAGTRGTGEMSWALRPELLYRGALFEYEAALNSLVKEYPHTACCQYDARRFDGQTIFDVLRVHPLAIVRGQLVRNPYFVEPAIFLEEFRSRRAAA